VFPEGAHRTLYKDRGTVVSAHGIERNSHGATIPVVFLGEVTTVTAKNRRPLRSRAVQSERGGFYSAPTVMTCRPR
jgi:hypothetical protein